jgi:CelD/BcsL family acetyltransferase involved in cellulose biosynthesis
MLADPAVRSFHREAARGLLHAGVLRLYTLYVGDDAAASSYGFLHRGRAYCYLTGFDPELSHLSPGHLVLHGAMSEAAREGAHTFDMLRGEETYKARWQAVPVANLRRTLRPRRVPRGARVRRPSTSPVGP